MKEKELFSYHIIKLSFFRALKLFLFPLRAEKVEGLNLSMTFFTMVLGKSVLSILRYRFTTLALVFYWKDEDSFEKHLSSDSVFKSSKEHWCVKMRPYRRWGSLMETDGAHLFDNLVGTTGPVIGLTLAKLRLTQVFRFAKWGRPVEEQVANHKGKTLAVVSMRPLNKFSTFSVWKNEEEMKSMVFGTYDSSSSKNHADAMKERMKTPFHSEFTTMRFVPFEEKGSVDGVKGLTGL